MAEFTVVHRGKVHPELDSKLGFKVITKSALFEFWKSCTFGTDHGVYVFAIKKPGPGPAIPYYVGKADKTTFKTETFNASNFKAYAEAMLHGHGIPEIYLIAINSAIGAPSIKAIDELETFLIWVALHRNPDLVNTLKTNTAPKRLATISEKNRIVGVFGTVGSGAPTANAKAFRKMMGL